ncbi:MAG: MFS transporter [Bacteroidales bacterium]|nr:MFS transporter [Bacteroidales bacterium]
MAVRRLIVVAAVLPIVAVCFYVLPSCGIVPLAIGNAIKGSSFGILTAVSPLLIVEKTEEERRERGSAFFQLSMQIGSVVGALLGAGVSALFRQRLQLALDIDFMLMLLPVALFLPLAMRLPECGWAVRVPAVSFKMSFSRLRVVLPAVGFMMLMSATGAGTVMNYAVVVLNDAGFAGATANLVDALMRALSIVAVIVAACVVDRVGRMRLLRASAVLMAVGFAGAAMTSGAAFAVFLLFAVMSFSGGFGACAWAVVPEMLPSDVRAQGTSLALFAGQIATCAMIAGFPYTWYPSERIFIDLFLRDQLR